MELSCAMGGSAAAPPGPGPPAAAAATGAGLMDGEDYESLPSGAALGTHMVAGAVAGIMEHTVMYPVDSVKVRGDSGGRRGKRAREGTGCGHGAPARSGMCRGGRGRGTRGMLLRSGQHAWGAGDARGTRGGERARGCWGAGSAGVRAGRSVRGVCKRFLGCKKCWRCREGRV